MAQEFRSSSARSCGIGVVLFAVPSVGESYWKSFFRWQLLFLGWDGDHRSSSHYRFVMNSVGQDRVGAASGITMQWLGSQACLRLRSLNRDGERL